MTKDRKSMDDVLASIRRIIRTDPNAVPPDASSLPPGAGLPDETAKAVLDKLRKGGTDDDLGKPLSSSDDPEETARAVLEHLRRQAEQEKAAKAAKAPDVGGAAEADIGGVAEAEVGGPAEDEPDAPVAEAALPPKVDTPLEEPPTVATDADEVPVVEDEDSGYDDPLRGLDAVDSLILEDAPGRDERDEAPRRGGRGRDDRSARADLQPPAEDEEPEVLAPRQKKAPTRQPDLPQPVKAATPAQKDAPVMIDEGALEAMVRRVVRDELMGDMGKRMTKNVQKMIKDEIARGQIEKK